MESTDHDNPRLHSWKPTILGREVVIIGEASKADAYRFLKKEVMNRKTRLYACRHSLNQSYPSLARNPRILAHLSASDRFLSFRDLDSKSMPVAVCLNLAISMFICLGKQAIKKRQATAAATAAAAAPAAASDDPRLAAAATSATASGTERVEFDDDFIAGSFVVA
ncbi:unnamed protein product [Ectocarpus sp. 12 AP-2014]